MEKNQKNDITHPLVSVIVPIYGVENYIEQCARSLFEQTLEDIEYVFVDDCSLDNSVNILLRVLNDYQSRQSQVNIIRHNNNCGLAQARMTGFQYANGKYLTSIDSDDWIDHDSLEQLVNIAIQNNADVVIYDTTTHLENGEIFLETNYIDFSVNVLSDMFCYRISPIIPTCLFRRSYIDDKLLSLPTSDMAEDLVYSTYLLFYAKTISHLRKPFYHYRYNPQSITNSKGVSATIKRFKGILQNTNQVIAFLEEKGLQNKYRFEILNLKHIVKYTIWPAVYEKSAYKLWQEAYPEIVNEIIFHRYYSLRTRFLYFTTNIGLYPLYQKMKYELKFRLHFRPIQ